MRIPSEADGLCGNLWLRAFLPWAAWVGLVWLMVRDWQRDPYNPALQGTAAYATTWMACSSRDRS
jgi:hypothetical protein